MRSWRWRLLVLLVASVAAACGGTSEAPDAPDAAAERWQPEPGVTWQWQLTGTVDTDVDAEVFDLDPDWVRAEDLATLRAEGRKLICYVNAGAYEPWRADAGALDGEVIGAPLDGWPDERWLDVRRTDVLVPVMAARLDRCRALGFDGVELDNVDGYANDTGFPLTAEDQVTYNRALARAAHERGLAVGLKNAVELVPALVADFDFAVNEECVAFGECRALLPFVEAGKAVLHVEYDLAVEDFCPLAGDLGLSSMRKRLDLDAWREPC